MMLHFVTGYDSGYDYGMSYDSGGSGKEMTLKKVYELALTAIAYLAFGIFVLHVIMCITTVRSFIANTKSIVHIFELYKFLICCHAFTG